MTQSHDKRRYPRVARKIQVRSTSRGTVELETIDLSVGGLFCTAPAYVPPMTKLALSLLLPDMPDATEAGDHVVKGEAVVVRAEPAPSATSGDGPCRVALFFTRMDEDDRRRLQSFLNHHAGRAGG